ncbi:hypothetical protein R69927_05947 [Paraburkholderia domus]|nr:hypothetical protein R69927_05947 [Paraburkholderia domus]
MTIPSRQGDRTAGRDLLDIVEAALSAEDQRPLNDTVTAESAEIVRHRIRAKGYTRSAIGADVLIAQANRNTQADTIISHRLGGGIAESAIKGVCQAAGLSKTELLEPAGDLVIGPTGFITLPRWSRRIF